MKNSEYWQERFKQMEEAEHDTSVQKVQEIQEQFERALAAINGKINAWYQRLANNNGVSMQEARKLLDQKELKEFHWNVEDYIKYAEENAISGAWAKQLENASARVHIGRLEALKIDTQQEMEKLYGNCIDAVDNHISNLYTSDFYHTAYEVQKGIGIGTSMNRLDPNMVEKIVRKPWAVDGKNFSDRLWENKTKLINNVHNSLTRMCITGESPDRAINEIAGQMKVSKAQAGRVVMTESAAFANQAREDAMKELDVEQFEVVETLDSHTCELCGSMDGKHFPMSEYQIGVTAPPFHPNCRGCTCPYFGDEFDNVGERAARGEDGKTYYVPADMTYKEWKGAFVDGNIDYMSNSFRPQYGKEKEIQIDKLKMNVRPVKNSSFEMLTDTDNPKNKAVRLTEKMFKEIQKELPETFKMPKIVVVDFEKQGLKNNAIGGYLQSSGMLFINSKYDTKQKILGFVNAKNGFFANSTENAPFLHELGHKFYYDAIEKLANKDKISYSKAKNRIDYSIYHYIESKKDKYFLLNNISEYANTQAVTEICAEAFSVRENNEIAKTIISLIGDDWQ